MKTYLSYFTLKFKMGLQYRAAAYAGILCQLFFGFIFAFVYVAFYESNTGSVPMDLPKLISYVWLVQAFYALFYLGHKDKEIINMIKNGNISYELTRPQNLYMMWFSKIYGDKLSSVALRCLPIFLITIFLPSPYTLNLSITLERFLVFLPSFFLASILICSFIVLVHTIIMFTLDEKGVISMFIIMADILAGVEIPLAFFPNFLKTISNFLPFRYMTDMPLRLYVGDIPINEGLIGILAQLIWIILFYILGNILMKKALVKATIQGG